MNTLSFLKKNSSPSGNAIVLCLLGMILVFGFWMRNTAVQETIVKKTMKGDATDYYFYAYNLRHYHTYSREITIHKNPDEKLQPDALRMPGYPLFLMLFVDSVPSYPIAQRIFFAQAIISTLSILLTFFLFRKMMPVYPCLILCTLVAASPHLINFNLYILSETLFGFVLLLYAWSLARLIRHPSTFKLFLAGMLMGLGILIRSNLQLLLFFLIPFWMMHDGAQKGLRYTLITALGALLVLSPWFLRNTVQFGMLSDDRLKVAWVQHGMYPDFMYRNQPESLGYPYQFDPNSQEVSRSAKTILREISRRFQDEPMRHLKWFLFQKTIAFWSWNIVQGTGDTFVYEVLRTPYASRPLFVTTHQVMYYLHWPLVILSLAGCVLAWIPIPNPGISREAMWIARFVACILLYYNAVHLIGAPWPRYSVPLRPFTYGMAVFSIVWIGRRMVSLPARPATAGGS